MLAAATAATQGGSNFLIPNGTILVELVIFVVVLGAMGKFVLPALRAVMDERAERIRADQAASEAGSSEAATLDAERQRVLDEARSEARTRLAQASEQASHELAEARARGLAELERRAALALAEVESERSRVEGELLGRLEALVAEAAGRVLGEAIEPAEHRAMLAEALAEARASVAR